MGESCVVGQASCALNKKILSNKWNNLNIKTVYFLWKVSKKVAIYHYLILFLECFGASRTEDHLRSIVRMLWYGWLKIDNACAVSIKHRLWTDTEIKRVESTNFRNVYWVMLDMELPYKLRHKKTYKTTRISWKARQLLLFIKIKYHTENKKYKDSGLVFCVKVNKP